MKDEGAEGTGAEVKAASESSTSLDELCDVIEMEVKSPLFADLTSDDTGDSEEASTKVLKKEPVENDQPTPKSAAVKRPADTPTVKTPSKIAKKDEVTALTKKDEVTALTKKDEVTALTKKDEVTALTKKDEVTALTKKDEVTALTKKDEVTALTKKDEVTAITKKEELKALTKKDEVTAINKKDKVTALTKKDEITAIIKKDDVKVLTKKEEVMALTKKDDVTVLTKKDDVTVLTKKDDVTVLTKKDDVTVLTKKKEVEALTKKDEVTVLSLPDRMKTVHVDYGKWLCILHMPDSWNDAETEQKLRVECSPIEVVKILSSKEVDTRVVLLGFSTSKLCDEAYKSFQNKTFENNKLEVFRRNAGMFMQQFKQYIEDVKAARGEGGKVVISRDSKPKLEPIDIWGEDQSGLYGLSAKCLKEKGIKVPLTHWVLVKNFKGARWELQELMDMAGTVMSCRLLQTPAGSARVKYSHPVEAAQAVSLFNGQLYKGQALEVSIDDAPKTILPFGLAKLGAGFGADGGPVKDIIRLYERRIQGKQVGLDETWFTDKETEEQKEVVTESQKKVSPATAKAETKLDPQIVQVVNGLISRGVKVPEILTALRSIKVPNIELKKAYRKPISNSNIGKVRPKPFSSIEKKPVTPNPVRRTAEPNRAPVTNYRNRGSNGSFNGPGFGSQDVEPISVWADSRHSMGNAPSVSMNAPAGPNMGNAPMGPKMGLNAPMGPNMGLNAPMGSNMGLNAPTGPYMGNAPQGPNMGNAPMGPNMGNAPIGPNMGNAPMGSNMGMNAPVLPAMGMNMPMGGQNSASVELNNLPVSMSYNFLREKMGQCGAVQFLKLTIPGSALVRFTNEWEAKRCVETFNNTVVEGHRINVRFC